ncbi:hypothetical protein [Catenovulum sediminis]|uniref:Solute-binding protein family 3/N-terminal domain-containing protein n=1 Tax=Catenovulum sediminis TaxID=1740262 RepID=A0ABV1RCW4_9ALTE
MKFYYALFILLFSTQVFANTTYTLQASFEGDTKSSYEYQALKLALDKTQPHYGRYKLNITNEPIPPKRYVVEANSDSLSNFIFVDSVNQSTLNQLSHANFPVMLGIIGYRVPLISTELKQRGYQVDYPRDLRNFSMVQGRGWLDTDILKDNGFTVHTGKHIEGLFYMVANERADFFPIGATQISNALDNFKHVKGLTVDDKTLLYYPLPRFFFMGKKHQQKLIRIEEGLIHAYQDGSLQTLWRQHFQQALDQIAIKQRKLFKLHNKFIEGINKEYEQYVYNPFVD